TEFFPRSRSLSRSAPPSTTFAPPRWSGRRSSSAPRLRTSTPPVRLVACCPRARDIPAAPRATESSRGEGGATYMARQRLRFGAFIPPHIPPEENPILAFEHD